jgi:hypothetical protein
MLKKDRSLQLFSLELQIVPISSILPCFKAALRKAPMDPNIDI